MECKYCAHEIADTDQRCIFCGRTNEDYVERELTEEEKQQDWQTRYENLRKSVNRNAKSSLKVTFIVPIVFVIIMLILGSGSCSGAVAAGFFIAVFLRIGIIICGLAGLGFSFGSISSYRELRKMVDKGDEDDEPLEIGMAYVGLILSLAEIIVPIVLILNSFNGMR